MQQCGQVRGEARVQWQDSRSGPALHLATGYVLYLFVHVYYCALRWGGAEVRNEWSCSPPPCVCLSLPCTLKQECVNSLFVRLLGTPSSYSFVLLS